VFVPGKPFQPSLMFAGKAGAYPSEAPFSLFCPIRDEKSFVKLINVIKVGSCSYILEYPRQCTTL
jgi:hypothetical protein